MSISIRLDAKTEAELRLWLREQQIPLSEFVREAVREKLANDATARSPYEIGEAVFGQYSSGNQNLSRDRKTLLKDKLQARHRDS